MTLMDQEKGRAAGISRFLKEEVVSRHADLLLFTCCLTSGLVDSTIYNGLNLLLYYQYEESNSSSLRYFRLYANR